MHKRNTQLDIAVATRLVGLTVDTDTQGHVTYKCTLPPFSSSIRYAGLAMLHLQARAPDVEITTEQDSDTSQFITTISSPQHRITEHGKTEPEAICCAILAYIDAANITLDQPHEKSTDALVANYNFSSTLIMGTPDSIMADIGPTLIALFKGQPKAREKALRSIFAHHAAIATIMTQVAQQMHDTSDSALMHLYLDLTNAICSLRRPIVVALRELQGHSDTVIARRAEQLLNSFAPTDNPSS